MRAVAPLLICALLAVGTSAPAANASAAGAFELDASLGYAMPLGDAERYGRVRDTTFGAVTIAVDAAYRMRAVALVVGLQYGVSIPTLCQTAGDCTASLGSDVVTRLGVRLDPPTWGPLSPEVDVGVGYEWLTTRLSDSGAHSSRSYDGPVLLWGSIAAPFRLSARWILGPIAQMTLGTFTGYGIETNVGSSSGNVPERSMHAWVSLGARLAARF